MALTTEKERSRAGVSNDVNKFGLVAMTTFSDSVPDLRIGKIRFSHFSRCHWKQTTVSRTF